GQLSAVAILNSRGGGALRLPFSISLMWLMEMPMASASWACVRPLRPRAQATASGSWSSGFLGFDLGMGVTLVRSDAYYKSLQGTSRLEDCACEVSERAWRRARSVFCMVE